MLLLTGLSAQASDKALFEDMAKVQEAIAGLKRHEIKLDGQKIFYLDNENVQAKESVLLIHGFGDRSLTWVQFSRRLRDAGYRIIAPDLLGFGKSDKPLQADYRYPVQSARLFALMKKLDIEKFHVIGNSMGGAIAAQMALVAPDKVSSLTMIDSAGIHYKPTELDREMLNGRNLLVIKTPQDFETMMDLVAYKRIPAPRPMLDYLAEQMINNSALHERILREALFEDINFLMLEMEKIRTPTLIVWGEKDRLLHPDNAKVLHHFIKGSRLVMMPETGHIPQMEAPFESSAFVVDFIKSVVGP